MFLCFIQISVHYMKVNKVCSHILGVEITLFYCWIPFKGTNPRLKAFDSQSIKIPLVSVMVSGPICTFQNFEPAICRKTARGLRKFCYIYRVLK